MQSIQTGVQRLLKQRKSSLQQKRPSRFGHGDAVARDEPEAFRVVQREAGRGDGSAGFFLRCAGEIEGEQGGERVRFRGEAVGGADRSIEGGVGFAEGLAPGSSRVR